MSKQINGTAVDRFLSDVNRFLCDEYMLNLKTDWLNGIPKLCNSENPKELGYLIFKRFLISDMKDSGGGVNLLPDGVRRIPQSDPFGPFILQGHLLYMTDGIQSVFGVESKPIRALKVVPRAGFKVCIRNLNVLNGIIQLGPENFKVLGGMVEHLETKRKELEDKYFRNISERVKRLIIDARNGELPAMAPSVPSSSSEGLLGTSTQPKNKGDVITTRELTPCSKASERTPVKSLIREVAGIAPYYPQESKEEETGDVQRSSQDEVC